ncbi:MazG nucleotide pyrophosphohydrolase domain-containing protein [Nocardioides convexus]|uniref:MazG nucleotide pyrophosphohydrolase domain-containing protein n=1 Tax=Nocardioides convexus TaxID=2712224 RepID=UPI0024187A76|nr:MazG nucleotide pyrophosphohydrolase domain-containing protein [Nocardioides convexus]
MRRLRAECPWKREQTHRSLVRYLLEETYETVEAVDDGEASGDWSHLAEEPGDLLLQVVFHAAIAEERGEFGLDEVARGITAKMIRRNVHVFGDVDAGETRRRGRQRPVAAGEGHREGRPAPRRRHPARPPRPAVRRQGARPAGAGRHAGAARARLRRHRRAAAGAGRRGPGGRGRPGAGAARRGPHPALRIAGFPVAPAR